MNKPYICAFITIFFWGSTAAISSLVLDSISTLALVFYGSLVATIFLLVLNIVTGRIGQVKEITGRDYANMFVVGMLGIFLYNVLLFFGMTRILVQQAFIINYLWPICIVIFSCIILKEKLT
ncbi:MAG: DMT family transporter, partial [Clostridia bacterium]|nr:DMT family transporter [Clostridia bacterium]